MNRKKSKPVILAIAGPNGSGKTTISRCLHLIGTYINADDLKKQYNLSDLEAAELAESFRAALVNSSKSITFETVLSTTRNLHLLQTAKAQGYEVQCIYVLTCDENINVARVKARCTAGGHDVPEAKIRERYHRALALLPEVIDICDNIIIYDNSSVPHPIFEKAYSDLSIYPSGSWSKVELRSLLGEIIWKKCVK